MRFGFLAVPVILAVAGAAIAAEPAGIQDKKDRVSYGIGVDIGNNLKRNLIDVNPDMVSQGLKDALGGGKVLMTDNEVRETLTAFQKEMMAKQQEHMKQLAEKTKKEGEEFLAGNKGKEGVVVLPDGLQYKVLKAGDGPKPKATDTVEVNYRGTLVNGTEFDSSYKRGQAATFPVNAVIKGWTEALQLMPVGSKWQIFLPPELAYGDRAVGRDIPANSTLIFEVDLLGIQANKDEKEPKEQAPEKK